MEVRFNCQLFGASDLCSEPEKRWRGRDCFGSGGLWHFAVRCLLWCGSLSVGLLWLFAEYVARLSRFKGGSLASVRDEPMF